MTLPSDTPEHLPLRARMQAGLKDAMKRRDRAGVTALRTALAAIDNAGAVEAPTAREPVVGRSADVPRRALSDADERAIVAAQAADLRSAVAEYERLGRPEHADELRVQLAVLEEYV